MERPLSKKSLSSELQEMFDSDQDDRVAQKGEWGDSELSKSRTESDAKRLVRAREIYDEYTKGEVVLLGEELVQLAFLFQHSLVTDDYKKVVELGNAAGEEGKWIAAAGEDRWLISKGEKQKWGTQFTHDGNQAPMLSDEESGVTDEMRQERGIPARVEQLSVHQGQSNSSLKNF